MEPSTQSSSIASPQLKPPINETTIVTDEEDNDVIEGVSFVDYRDERQLQSVMDLVGRDLSEPYSIFTFRYFLLRFPQLCILAVVPKNKKKERNGDNQEENDDDEFEPIGCVVGKIDDEEIYLHGTSKVMSTGYIGMLAVNESYRRQGIGKALVKRVLYRMKSLHCTSVTLETEVSNITAQKLYQNSFGFVREELLVRYYLNWGDAYRLRLWFS